MVERVPTGIKNLDDLIEGGLPKGKTALVSGTPGTFKSILCQQILYDNAIKGRKCLYITFEQTADAVKEQMKQFGWGFDKVDGKLTILSFDSDDPDILDKIWAQARKGKYELLALDSLASLAGAPLPPEQMSSYSLEQIMKSVVPVPMDAENVSRMKIKTIINYLMKSGATALLISEIIEGQSGYSRDTISEFLCDGIIQLIDTGIAGEMAINIAVKKMRFTKIDRNFHAVKITNKGLVVEKEASTVLLK